MPNFNLEINNSVKAPFKHQALFKQLGEQTLALLKIRRILAVSLAFVSPAAIRQVNRRYRNKDKVTDVLSFEDLNELMICYAKAKSQALEHHHSVKRELSVLFVHGLLHLLGYEDETDRGAVKMEKLVDLILKKTS